MRTGLDVGVLVLGVALGGPFGVGTVIYAALMGLVLHVVGQALADHSVGRHRRIAERMGTDGRSAVVVAEDAVARRLSIGSDSQDSGRFWRCDSETSMCISSPPASGRVASSCSVSIRP